VFFTPVTGIEENRVTKRIKKGNNDIKIIDEIVWCKAIFAIM
jgi:hypothetical protein